MRITANMEYIHDIYEVAVSPCGAVFLLCCYLFYRIHNLTGTTKQLYSEVRECYKKHAGAEARLAHAESIINQLDRRKTPRS